MVVGVVCGVVWLTCIVYGKGELILSGDSSLDMPGIGRLVISMEEPSEYLRKRLFSCEIRPAQISTSALC